MGGGGGQMDFPQYALLACAYSTQHSMPRNLNPFWNRSVRAWMYTKGNFDTRRSTHRYLSTSFEQPQEKAPPSGVRVFEGVTLDGFRSKTENGNSFCFCHERNFGENTCKSNSNNRILISLNLEFPIIRGLFHGKQTNLHPTLETIRWQ